MKNLFITLSFLISSFLSSSCAVAEPTMWSWPPIQCGNPCIISDNSGGIIDLFAAQARQMAAGHIPVIVDGPCMIDRANVCVTDRALLGHHKSARQDADGKLIFGNIHYETPGLEDYIKSQGGLPDPDSGHLLMLNTLEAAHFYRACT